MKAIKGWTALTETISGYELVWKSQEPGEEIMPDVYETEKEVQKEIARDLIEQLQQFIDGTREYDEVDLDSSDSPAQIEIDEEGNMVIWYGDIKETKHVLIEDTIDNWRKNL